MWRKLVLLLLLGSPSLWAACENTIPSSTPSGQLIDNQDGTVSDLKTGLMWKQCSEGLTSADLTSPDCATGTEVTLSWDQALQQPQTLNVSGGFAGHTDWRLPNIKELLSILEEQCTYPPINTAFFPNTPRSIFWSSSPFANYAGYAWFVDFYNGFSGYSYRTGTRRIRLVRGGQ
jgi:hypothetical protein